MSATRLGYIPKGYPRVSETFISNEIRELERLGFAIEIFALKRPEGSERHPSIDEVRAPLVYLPEKILRSLPRLLWVHAGVCRRQPRRYGRALAWTLRRSVTQRSTTTLRRFFQAGYLVGTVLRGRLLPHYHAHFCHGPATVAMFVKWLTGSPFSFTAHAKDLYLTPPALLREKMREADFVVTCTAANHDYLQRVGGDVTNVHRIYHGTDLSLFRAAGERATSDPPLLLSVGRLVDKKGFDTLLRACALLRDRAVPYRCVIHGDGPSRPALEELRQRLGLEDRVQFPGSILQPELVGVYARATAFVLACRILDDGDRDGLPNVLVEAMAMGLPVVSTSVSGIPELVVHDENGLLVPPQDPTALAAALQRLLGDRALQRRLGDRGRRTVHENFDLACTTQSLAQLFRSSLAARTSTRRVAEVAPAATGRAAAATPAGMAPWSAP